VYPYADFVANFPVSQLADGQYPTVLPNWDNTPRSGRRGLVLQGATPALFQQHLQNAVASVAPKPAQHRLVFVKAWNEWAEGNYLEPDQAFGHGWLEACRNVLLPADALSH
jgi:hypothetical protein